jgi:hypothetical protein
MINARRLAAADMWGSSRTPRRRKLIRAEFVIGAIGCTILGVLALTRANGVVWQLLGVWLVGAGVNCVPLALHTQSLSRRCRAERNAAERLARVT